MENNTTKPLRERALDVAITQIGKEEKPHGSNWGDTVQMYLNSVGINFPASWCMAFVYWCFKQAGLTQELPKTGGVLAMWNTCNAALHSKTPKVGSIIIFDHGKGLGHTGIVESIDGNTIHTIEGNTNNNGSREGIAVERKVRSLTDKTLKGFITV
jgi:hypothetical protein